MHTGHDQERPQAAYDSTNNGALSSIKITWAIPHRLKVPNGQNKHNSSGNMINISINGFN